MIQYAVRNINEQEKKIIIKRLGREPNDVEWAMIDVMWSEHISYKSSRAFIKKYLRSSGRHVIVGPGQDAGVIELAKNLYVAFKIESHNHPSAVDPYGGASTGIGGIVRDILSMGAQPIALLDSLHFGDPEKRRTWFHILGVVKGISDYGNRIGVPTVGGETKFSSCYNDNPLVNVACVGVVKKIVPSVLSKVGAVLVLYGNRTGRDGIHGVSFASETLDDESIEEDRSAVQIGDPLTEKLLIEASMEMFNRDLAYALKDLGGGGITCAVSEMVGKGGIGAIIDLDKVPLREENMSPYEILISESQERMLLATDREHLRDVLSILEKYDLQWAIIGKSIPERRIIVKYKGKEIANLPVEILTDVPIQRHPIKPRKTSPDKYTVEFTPPPLEEALIKVLGSPNVSSKEWIYEQYDFEVQTRTVIKPGADAAVLKISEDIGVALTLDSCADYASIDPYEGAKGAVAEAYRNVISVGGEPLAIVDNINAGDPNNVSSYWAFHETIRGLGNAARALSLPIVGGNVSFYNESSKGAIWPTLVVCMLGRVHMDHVITPSLKSGNSCLILVGETYEELGGSEYLKVLGLHGQGEVPKVRYKEEKLNGKRVIKAITKGLVLSVHDISDGGLIIALAEMVIFGNRGIEARVKSDLRGDVFAFSESHARYVLEVPQEHIEDVLRITKGRVIGRTTNTSSFYFEVNNFSVDVPIKRLKETYARGVSLMGKDQFI